jgi:dienelactone hydrolase
MESAKSYLRIVLYSSALLMLLNARSDAQDENLKVLDDWVEWSNGGNMLQLYLNQQAYHMLDQREQETARLKTENDWQLRQEKVMDDLRNMVGQFPGKTPLNTQVTGIIHEKDFRVEKIIYESMPGFYVTGCLFIPEGGPAEKPAILNLIGHSAQSFRRDTYQNFIINLVKKGFIVLAIDPIGQGERLQYDDPVMRELIKGRTTYEHSYLANQCLLAGYPVAKYFIWDGIRGIDYLLTRNDVDPEKIGVTGVSGGGTQTAFVSAFDDRIKVSVPICYITSYRRLFESIGPQDGEQNLFHGIAGGIDHADLLSVRAPKPTLMATTTCDFFSIQGARETFSEVKKVYESYGEEENFRMSEADYEHGHNRVSNEAVYGFFREKLGNPGSSAEENVEIFPEAELNVTTTGQLMTSLQGKTVFDLNQSEVEKLAEKLRHSRNNDPGHLETVIQRAKELSGYIAPGDSDAPVFRGRCHRDGYSIEKYALHGDNGCVIPLLLAVPDGEGVYPTVIYIHPDGKEEGIAPGGTVEKLVKRGFMVAAPDLSGTGETRSSREYPGSHGYAAQLIGRSIVGIQAGDIVRVLNFLKGRSNVQVEKINAVAFGELCPALLHAAVFEPSVNGIVLIHAPVSYNCIAQSRIYNYSLSFNWGVAGVLTAYDLPDLAACVAPRKLALIELLNGTKEPASEKLIADEMEFPESVYGKSNAGNLIIKSVSDDEMIHLFSDWLKE